MVLNLSDQDSSHHAPNEGSNDHASVPSPESRSRPLSPPAGRATLSHLARAAEALNRNDDNDNERPIDFSVRRQESADSYRSNDSNLDSVGESIPPSPRDMADIERRRSSSMSEPPLSPGINGYRMEEKIGEPKLGLPGMNPGMPFPPLPGQLPPGFPLHMMANFNMLANLPPRNMDPKNGVPNGGNNKNNARPFKAYPKDPLSLPLGYFGLPGVPPLPGIDVASLQALNQGNNSEEMFKHYREYVLNRLDRERDEKRKSPTKHNGVKSEPISPVGSPSPLSPLSPPGGHTHAPPLSPRHPPFPHNFQPSPRASQPSVITANPNTSDIKVSASSTPLDLDMPLSNNNSPTSGSRKRGRSTDGMFIKDEAYWERRRKNNDAAKRSRDSRRAKEDEIAIRAAFLEQENLKLRVEVTALKNETAKLRCMLYNS